MPTRRRWALPLLAGLLTLLVVGALFAVPDGAGAASQTLEPRAYAYAGAVSASSCAARGQEARSQATGLDFTYYPDFDLHSDNGIPWSAWGDGTTLWVGDDADGKFYAYHLRDDPATDANEYGTRDSAKDIDGVTGETYIITGDDTYIWAVDFSLPAAPGNNGSVYAYNRTDRSRASGKDFQYRDAGGTFGPSLVFSAESDGSHIWLADSFKKAHAYHLTDDLGTGADEYGTEDASRDITFSFRIDGLHIEGDTIWAASSGSGGKAEARRLSDGSRLPAKDIALGNADIQRRGIWSNGVTMFVVDNTNDKILTYRQLDNASGLAVSGTPLAGERLTGDLVGAR